MAFLLAEWSLTGIIAAAEAMYKIYSGISYSEEDNITVDEAMKLIKEQRGDIDRLMENNKKFDAVLEGLTLLMTRLNQHFENQANPHFPPSKTMAPPCCHGHYRPWGSSDCHCHGTRKPSGCHHYDARGPSGCHHYDARGPSGCHHYDARGPSGCHHYDARRPSGHRHHDARGPSDRRHHGEPSHGCHYEDSRSPSRYRYCTQELSDEDDEDEDWGAASSESSSREGSWKECCVCRSNYNMTNKRPTLLACGHTFCRKCIGMVAQHGPLLCPTCRAHEKRPSALLPSNVVLMAALEEEGQRRENGRQNNGDWEKKFSPMQEEEVVQMIRQMFLQSKVGCDAKMDSKHDPEDNGNLQTIMNIKDSCIKLEKHITDDVLPKVGRISLGLTEGPECRRELVRLRKELTSANGRLMCHLEQLDAMDFKNTDSQGRQRKKDQVKKLLDLMEQIDKMQENINQLMLKYT